MKKAEFKKGRAGDRSGWWGRAGDPYPAKRYNRLFIFRSFIIVSELFLKSGIAR